MFGGFIYTHAGMPGATGHMPGSRCTTTGRHAGDKLITAHTRQAGCLQKASLPRHNNHPFSKRRHIAMQKVAFQALKGGISQPEMPPFRKQEVTY